MAHVSVSHISNKRTKCFAYIRKLDFWCLDCTKALTSHILLLLGLRIKFSYSLVHFAHSFCALFLKHTVHRGVIRHLRFCMRELLFQKLNEWKNVGSFHLIPFLSFFSTKAKDHYSFIGQKTIIFVKETVNLREGWKKLWITIMHSPASTFFLKSFNLRIFVHELWCLLLLSIDIWKWIIIFCIF